MLRSIVVDHQTAKLLAMDHHDVGVFSSKSGDFWTFSLTEAVWMHCGAKKTLQEILDRGGVIEMDKEYTFIWVSAVPK